MGPAVEKVTRVVLTSRVGLRSDPPWLEILGALDRLEARHGFDPQLVTTLRWLAQPHPESTPTSAGQRPSSKREGRATK